MKHAIHISDVNAFLQCRRSWNWSSNLREHLTTIKPYEPFYFGTVIHKFLECWYRSEQFKDRAFGIAISELKQNPYADDEFIDFGNALCEHYLDWQRFDTLQSSDRNLTFLACEQNFQVPIMTPSGVRSNKFVFAGTVDGVMRSKVDGKLYLHEIKTTKSIDSRIQQLAFEYQPTAYLWAMQQVYQEPIEGVIYSLIRKKLPVDPDVLTNGKLSKNKAIDTTPEHYLNCAKRQHPTWSNEQIRAEYGEILNALLQQPNKFFRRVLVKRTQAELDQMQRVLYDVAKDMTRRDLPLYPNPGYFCSNCLFAEPCRLMSTGQPFDTVLSEHYTRNTRLD